MLLILLAVLLAAHLLLLDVAMAGPLVCVGVEWRARRANDAASDEIARRLAGWSLWALVGGSVVGGLLLVVRYTAGGPDYFRAYQAIPVTRLWFGFAELIFSLACLSAYFLLWNRCRSRRLWHRLLALAGASNLLMHFPALFVIISVVGTRLELAGATIDRAAFRRLLVDPEVLARVTHVWLAAVAVSGIALMMLALRAGASPEAVPARKRQIALGGRLALGATVLQFPAGMWLVLQTPTAAQGLLLGGDWLATCLFLGSLLLSMLLLQALAAVSLGDVEATQVRRAVATVAVLVLLMTATRLRIDAGARPLAGGAEHETRAAATESAAAGLVLGTTSDSIGRVRIRNTSAPPAAR